MEQTYRPAALAVSVQQAAREAVKIATLTAGERQIIRLVGEGFKNKQIAQRLRISVTMVGRDLRAIIRKLGVAERLDLILYAYRYGLAKISAEG
jgi:two-component system, NarL family, nitrate/nitrite response regulator NarL